MTCDDHGDFLGGKNQSKSQSSPHISKKSVVKKLFQNNQNSKDSLRK